MDYNITDEELKDITGFMAEATEIIDNLVTGNNRTYKQLADMGLIVKPVRRFMKKHRNHIPITQAVVNQKERTKEAQERVNADRHIDTVEVTDHDGTLKSMSRREESK